MAVLDKFATGVVGELRNTSSEAVIDPSIFELIKLIAEIVVPLIEKCMDARQARLAAGNPTPLQKVWLNVQIRREMGRREFRLQNGKALTDASLRAFSKLSEDEAVQLFREV